MSKPGIMTVVNTSTLFNMATVRKNSTSVNIPSISALLIAVKSRGFIRVYLILILYEGSDQNVITSFN